MAACAVVDPSCLAGQVASSVVSPFLDGIVASLMQGVSQMLITLSTLWVQVGTPNLTSGPGSSISAASAPHAGGFTTVLQWAVYVALGFCVAGLIAVGAMLAVRHRRGEGTIGLHRAGLALFGVLLVGAAYQLITAVMPAPSGGGAVGFIQSATAWFAAGLAVLSVVIAGARMAWQGRGQPGIELVEALVRLLVVAGTGVSAVWLLTQAGDGFATWILAEAGSGSFAANLAGMFALTTLTGNSGVGSVLLLLLGLVLLLFALLQIVLMVVRVGMLVILSGLLPVSASFTTTAAGRAWFRRHLGWLIGFLLYKPVAAVIYATAFKLAGSNVFASDRTGLLKVVVGMGLMLMALIALPALMRFAVPAVAPVTGSGLGTALAAGAGSIGGGTLATGALRTSPTGTPGGGTGGGPGGRLAGGAAGGAGPAAGGSGGAAASGAAGAGAAGAGAGSATGAAAAAGPAAPVVLGALAGARTIGAVGVAGKRAADGAASS